jgi:hypothetical protein
MQVKPYTPPHLKANTIFISPLYPPSLLWSRNGKISFMDPEAKWKWEYDSEIDHAISARRAGNEGMARVCARRAAGIILGEYLIRQGYTNISNSTIDRLSIFISIPDVDQHHQDIANHFLLKVNPDYKLPETVDLISDAEWLRMNLLLE